MNKILLLAGAVALSLSSAFADSSTDISTRTFVLKYAKATEVADSLNKLCEKLQVKEAAVAFPESHSVAVAGPQSVVEACAKIVADVDRKPKQFMLRRVSSMCLHTIHTSVYDIANRTLKICVKENDEPFDFSL